MTWCPFFNSCNVNVMVSGNSALFTLYYDQIEHLCSKLTVSKNERKRNFRWSFRSVNSDHNKILPFKGHCSNLGLYFHSDERPTTDRLVRIHQDILWLPVHTDHNKSTNVGSYCSHNATQKHLSLDLINLITSYRLYSQSLESSLQSDRGH